MNGPASQTSDAMTPLQQAVREFTNSLPDLCRRFAEPVTKLGEEAGIVETIEESIKAVGKLQARLESFLAQVKAIVADAAASPE